MSAWSPSPALADFSRQLEASAFLVQIITPTRQGGYCCTTWRFLVFIGGSNTVVFAVGRHLDKLNRHWGCVCTIAHEIWRSVHFDEKISVVRFIASGVFFPNFSQIYRSRNYWMSYCYYPWDETWHFKQFLTMTILLFFRCKIVSGN